MLSPEYIEEQNFLAAKRASEEKKTPFVVWPGDSRHMPPFPFPYIGDYVPDGWEKVDEYFVDSSGLGVEGEGALTGNQFRRIVEEFAGQNYGFAITSAGQFQVYVGLYKKN